MMDQLSKELKEQLEGMRTFYSLGSKIEEMHKQLHQLEEQIDELTKACEKEQKDVVKLEKSGLHSFYLKIRKKYEETMDKEVLEAAAAKVKLQNKEFEVQDLKRRIEVVESEKRKYIQCEEKYRELYERKLNELMEGDNQDRVSILEYKTKISNAEQNKKEISEAISVGKSVLEGLEETADSLDSAESCGTWDIAGGGMMADMMKHSHLDDAKEQVEHVQLLMRNFRTELADVKMDLEIHIDTDGFAKFADFVFDGLFADLSMQDRIHEAQDSVEESKHKVEQVMNKLQSMLKEEDNQIVEFQNEIDRIINQE